MTSVVVPVDGVAGLDTAAALLKAVRRVHPPTLTEDERRTAQLLATAILGRVLQGIDPVAGADDQRDSGSDQDLDGRGDIPVQIDPRSARTGLLDGSLHPRFDLLVDEVRLPGDPQVPGNSAHNSSPSVDGGGGSPTVGDGTAAGVPSSAPAAGATASTFVADLAVVMGLGEGGRRRLEELYVEMRDRGSVPKAALDWIQSRGVPVYAWLGVQLGLNAAELARMASKDIIAFRAFRRAVRAEIDGIAAHQREQALMAAASAASVESAPAADAEPAVTPEMLDACANHVFDTEVPKHVATMLRAMAQELRWQGGF